MAPLVALSKAHPRSMAIHATSALVGSVFLVDGLLHGEPRHRAAAVMVALPLLLPLGLIALMGERALRICNRLAVSAVTLVLLIAGLEVTVRALDVRAFSHTEVVRDPVYGHVQVPGRGWLDAWGYSNPRVPESADIVCLGDSQTVGTNIPRQDNYVSAIARKSGLEVYNMSLGGYGPLQYVEMAKHAMELEPKAVTIGFYFGNDLADANRFLGLDHWSELRDPALSYTVPNDVDYGDKRSLNLAMAVLDGLMLHSVVLRRVGNDLKLAIKTNERLRGLGSSERGGSVYEDAAVGTSLTPRYRIGFVSLASPGMRDGLRITEHCFEQLGALFAPADVQSALLLIHNKEFYYHDLMALRGEEIPPQIARLERLERALTEKIIGFAEAAGMAVVDPTEELVQALAAGVAVFPADVDAHLNRAGSEIVGRALWREIGPAMGGH